MGITHIFRIVLVDDNPDTTLSTQLLLVAKGYEVWVANSGMAALHLIRQVQPDVVFCDIGMPGMNGYQVAKAIQADAFGKKVRLFAVTAAGEDDDIARAMSAGFERHFLKPTPFQDILAQVEIVKTQKQALGATVSAIEVCSL